MGESGVSAAGKNETGGQGTGIGESGGERGERSCYGHKGQRHPGGVP